MADLVHNINGLFHILLTIISLHADLRKEDVLDQIFEIVRQVIPW
jgi:hypothetical protein